MAGSALRRRTKRREPVASNKVQQIERAIGELAPGELKELYVWLDQNYPQPIDDQIQIDLEAGRLDAAISRALVDEENRRVRPF